MKGMFFGQSGIYDIAKLCLGKKKLHKVLYGGMPNATNDAEEVAWKAKTGPYFVVNSWMAKRLTKYDNKLY